MGQTLIFSIKEDFAIAQKKTHLSTSLFAIYDCHYLPSKQIEEHLSQEMLRNARAFHTFFLGVSQVPEPRKVWCHKWSIWHSSWLCTAFFYSTALNGSNRKV